MGKPTPEQLARINQLARTPLTEDQVYVFNAKLIGDNPIPMRFQRVTPNFLSKMADQAKQGVSLMLDHPWASWGAQLAIPYGRTFDAQLKQEPDGELALYADHYIVRDQSLNGINTNDIISSIDAGTMFDTSIGYITTKNICSLDGLDYNGGICPHYRGQTYDGQVCSVDQDDGQLMENSLVFDGAYPGAGVVAASNKHGPGDDKHSSSWILIEDAKSLKSGERVLYSFSQKSGLHAYAMKSNHEGVDQVNELEEAKQKLSTAESLLSTVRNALGNVTDSEIASAITKLSAQAQLGKQYQTKVVEEACGAGVRALGEAFNVESMKLALANLPVAEVEKIRDTYEAQAKAALGGGGRHTEGAGHELPDNPEANANGSGEPTDEQKREQAREAARAALKRFGHSDLVKGDDK